MADTSADERKTPDSFDGLGAEASTEPVVDHGKHDFLRFGGERDYVLDSLLDVRGARDYLRTQGLSHGSLTQARNRRDESRGYRGFHLEAVRQCDFCGRMLTGIEYDILADGRERCAECSSTTLRGLDSFVRLFAETKVDMCQRFAIDLDVSISVEVMDAKKLAKARGRRFIPTSGMDVRAVGRSVMRRGVYTIYLENGAPRLSLVSTIVHELTHVWQHTHWDMGKMRRRYGDEYLAVCEGMAVWAEAQYLFLINEHRHAQDYLTESEHREDAYGKGLRKYLEQYSISHEIALYGQTPFMNVEEPLDTELMAAK